MTHPQKTPPRSTRENAFYAIQQIENLRLSGLLEAGRAEQEVFLAIVTRILVLLKDALKYANDDGKRVNDTGDDIAVVGQEGDLSALIAFARNCLCHVGSPDHYKLDNTWRAGFVTNGVVAPNTIKPGRMSSMPQHHPGETTLIFGTTPVRVVGHILRAHNVLKALYPGALGEAVISVRTPSITYRVSYN